MKNLRIVCMPFICALIFGCGGGGGTGSNESPPPTQPTNFTLNLSTNGNPDPGTIVRSASIAITLPSNVTVKMDGASYDVVIPSNAFKLVVLEGNELTVTVNSLDEVNSLPQNFASINCSYTGNAPVFSTRNSRIQGGPPGPLTGNEYITFTDMSVILAMQ